MDRRGYIGSGDIAAICGLNPWGTAYDVWEQKIAEEVIEKDSPILRRGKRMEGTIILTLQEEFDFFILERNIRNQHAKYPFLWAESDFTYRVQNTDAELDGHGEAKSIGHGWDSWGPSGSQEVPAGYIAQIMFAMAVNGLREATVAALMGVDDMRLYRFDYDPEIGEGLIEKAVNFWGQHVLAKTAPPSQTIDDTKKMLSRYQGFTWEASESALKIAENLKATKRTIKLMEAEKDSQEKAFMDALLGAAQLHGADASGDDTFHILGPDGRKVATYSKVDRKGYMVESTTYRQLRFSAVKGEK